MSQYQFTQQPNPVSGKLEWKAQNKDEYDYFKDVARSAYADMLHDTERNEMYFKAIRQAVKEMHERGKEAKVLDIGTGTGLLSMMAATAGADKITAIEVFEPVANVAKLVTKANGFDNIKVINKHSTEVSIGPEEEMKERANILITELFDTELIGEGALEAYEHAHAYLMEEDCIAVPHSATIFVQLVESQLMWSWHDLEPITIDGGDGTVTCILPDPKMKECPGVPAVHDIQLSQVQEDKFTKLTNPVEVFKFEWGSKELTSKSQRKEVEVTAKSSGMAQVALSWWTLAMDQNGDLVLSTAPYWYHPHPNGMQWRDHWIQSVYFLPNAFKITKGDSVTISANHDEYSLWFDARNGRSSEGELLTATRPACEYLPRKLWSRPRLGMLNDSVRNQAFANAFGKVEWEGCDEHVAVCVSDASLLPLIMARTCLSIKRIFSLETDHIGQYGLQNIIKHNGLSNSITILNKFPQNSETECFGGKKIDLLAGEPFFTSSLLPWHNLRFWYVRTELQQHLAKGAKIMPCRAQLHMAAVQFKDLWKIRAPVGNVQGFDISIMDDMIAAAMEMQEYHEAEPHALWEYPCVLLSEPCVGMTFDFTECVPSENMTSRGSIILNSRKNACSCHGIVLWMTYDLDNENTLTTGLITNDPWHSVWDMHHKQGVFFLRSPIKLTETHVHKIDYELTFIPDTGDIKMKFFTRE